MQKQDVLPRLQPFFVSVTPPPPSDPDFFSQAELKKKYTFCPDKPSNPGEVIVSVVTEYSSETPVLVSMNAQDCSRVLLESIKKDPKSPTSIHNSYEMSTALDVLDNYEKMTSPSRNCLPS